MFNISWSPIVAYVIIFFYSHIYDFNVSFLPYIRYGKYIPYIYLYANK